MNESLAPQLPSMPMRVGAILDRIWRLMRGHLRPLLLISAIPTMAYVVVCAVMMLAIIHSSALTRRSYTPAPVPPHVDWLTICVMLGGGALFFIVYSVYEAAGAYAAVNLHRGTTVTLRQAYGVAWRGAARYVWLTLLRALWVGLPCAVLLVGFAFGAGLLMASRAQNLHPGALFLLFPLLALAYAGAMVYAIWMAIRLALAIPASVMENLTAGAALRRSTALTSGSRLRIFVVFLAVVAVQYGIFFTVEMISMSVLGLGALVGSLHPLQTTRPATLATMGVGGACVLAFMLLWMAVLWASYAATTAVLYEDQRTRVGSPRELH